MSPIRQTRLIRTVATGLAVVIVAVGAMVVLRAGSGSAASPTPGATPGGSPSPIELHLAPGATYVPALDGKRPIYILALGSDARPGQGVDAERADSIHIIAYNPAAGRGTILGIPRDSWVNIPGHGTNKINSALYFGGPKLFGQTVGNLVGIQPDYVFITRFEKFQAMVNGIGGVNIYNPKFFADDPIKPKGFKAGHLHLTGYEAMAYSRIRHALLRGDFDRSAHQQVVVKAIQKKVRKASSRPGFLARGVVSVMENLHTDLSPVELYKLAHALADVDPAKVTNCVVQGDIGNVAGQSVVLPFVAMAHQMGQDAKKDAVISKCVSPW